mgnify:FL=1
MVTLGLETKENVIGQVIDGRMLVRFHFQHLTFGELSLLFRFFRMGVLHICADVGAHTHIILYVYVLVFV